MPKERRDGWPKQTETLQQYILRRHLKKMRNKTTNQQARIRFKRRQRRLFARDKYRCVYCYRGEKASVVLSRDHILPASFGGSRAEHNSVTACRDCNTLRSNRHWEEFILSDLFKNHLAALGVRYDPERITAYIRFIIAQEEGH